MLISKSDEELSKACRVRFFEKGYAPWAYWESERTGFGKLFRRRSFFPPILPLMVSSDHYVDPLVSRRANEFDCKAYAYLTWNKRKADLLSASGINALHVQHPWLREIKKMRRIRSEIQPNGTLVFWPHSHGTLTQDINVAEFFDELTALGPEYEPFTICLSSHDVERDLHKDLRHLGLPIVTAGAITSQRFPDDFLNLLVRFSYTAGPHSSSHTFYSLAMGIPFRLVAQQSFRYRRRDAGGKAGDVYDQIAEDYPDLTDRETIYAFHAELKKHHESLPDRLHDFAYDQMGGNSTTSRRDFTLVIWKALIHDCRRVIPLYLRKFRKSAT